MKKIFCLLVTILLGIYSFTAFADFNKPLKAKNHINKPAVHAKAWGTKHDWKNLTPEQRKAIKAKIKANKKLGKKHSKAWGTKHDWKNLTPEQKKAIKAKVKANKKLG